MTESDDEVARPIYSVEKVLESDTGTVVSLGGTRFSGHTYRGRYFDERAQDESWDRHHNRGRKPGRLECLAPSHDEAGHGVGLRWVVFVQHSNGRRFARHHDTGGDHPAPLTQPESDQHKWQKDYVSNAGQSAGYAVTEEKVLTQSRRRPDVTVVGPNASMALEVQVSTIGAENAVTRAGVARDRGMVPVWAAVNRRNPSFAFKVPHYETNLLPASPKPRSLLVVSGPSTVSAKVCNSQNFSQCPVTKRNFCGKYHPQLRPINEQEAFAKLTVDDLVEQVPAGEMVELFVKRGERHLVSAVDHALYVDLTSDAEWTPEPLAVSLPAHIVPHGLRPTDLVAVKDIPQQSAPTNYRPVEKTFRPLTSQVIGMRQDTRRAERWRAAITGPVCVRCSGPNEMRYGPLGHQFCLDCRVS